MRGRVLRLEVPEHKARLLDTKTGGDCILKLNQNETKSNLKVGSMARTALKPKGRHSKTILFFTCREPLEAITDADVSIVAFFTIVGNFSNLAFSSNQEFRESIVY